MKKTILLFLSVLMANLLPAQVWTPVLPYVTRNSLYCVHFPTEKVGYIAGGALFKSTDGGDTWNKITYGISKSGYGNIYFLDAENGYISNSISVCRTTNGGETWEEIMNGLPASGLNAQFVWFRDKTTGYVGGENALYKTTDGGKNWKEVTRNKISGMLFKAVDFQNATTGYAVGSYYSNGFHNGVIMKTTDGGETWTEQDFGKTDADFSAVTFVNDRVGYIAGGWHSANSVEDRYSLLLKTTDGGKTWKEYSFDTAGGDWSSLCFLDENTGYANIGMEVYKTINGGETWENITRKLSYLMMFYSLAITGYDKGVAVGYEGLICKLAPTPSGIEDMEIKEPLPYPNPAKGRIFLPCTGEKNPVVIYNTPGAEVGRVTISEGEQGVWIDVSHYSAGTYFYRCGNKDGKFTVIK